GRPATESRSGNHRRGPAALLEGRRSPDLGAWLRQLGCGVTMMGCFLSSKTTHHLHADNPAVAPSPSLPPPPFSNLFGRHRRGPESWDFAMQLGAGKKPGCASSRPSSREELDRQQDGGQDGAGGAGWCPLLAVDGPRCRFG